VTHDYLRYINILTYLLSYLLVTIRISIGDLIAGVGAATKTFAPGGKHPRAATTPDRGGSRRHNWGWGLGRGRGFEELKAPRPRCRRRRGPKAKA